MAKNAAPAGTPLWMVTFADLMSLLVCFFVLIVSFSVPDTKKMKIVAGSMRDAFGFQREIIVTGMVEIDGNPRYEYAQDLVPLPVEDQVGPIPDDGRDVEAPAGRAAVLEKLREMLEPFLVDWPIQAEEPEQQEQPEQPEQDQDEAALAPPSEQQRFEQAAVDLRQAIQDIPELQQLAENLQIEPTTEGLRIQIVDQARTSMFPLGSAAMYQPTQALLAQVARAIAQLPNKISISGHTDSVPFRRTDGYDNWSLSLARADATRRALLVDGLDAGRIATVIGKADTDPLIAAQPRDPRNRRISITLLREEPLVEEAASAVE